MKLEQVRNTFRILQETGKQKTFIQVVIIRSEYVEQDSNYGINFILPHSTIKCCVGQCPLELNSTCIAEMQKDLKLELRDLWKIR